MFLPSILFSAFFALKVFLWSLPIDQTTLFLIVLPLGGAYFWGAFTSTAACSAGPVQAYRQGP